MSPPPSTIPILGIPVHAVTMADTLALIEGYMAEPRVHQIATVNPEFVMAAQSDAAFRAVLRAADLCLPDGVGLLYAARWLGQALPERVPGSELVYQLAELAAARGWPLFLLGAAPGVADEAAAILAERYPGQVIAGTYAGSPDPAENEAIVQRINDSGAAILLVAYGAPKQDKWIARNRETLATVRVAIGVGGSLDFVTGRAVRAPQWAQDAGLEWLHRLYKEPWRWRRMLALPRFALKVLLSRGEAFNDKTQGR
jgi:N-acetylglucosaminyldiphosphoundecaprenol N-acetyl-beta-D-mannosaminyltransferase